MTNVYQAPQADLTPKRSAQHNDNPITQEMIDNIAKGRFWAKFIGILLYIAVGFIALTVIYFLIVGKLMGLIPALLFSIAGFVTFKMAGFLMTYSRSISSLMETGDVGDMLDAQESFGSYMKWLGVTTALGIVLFIMTNMFVKNRYTTYQDMQNTIREQEAMRKQL